MSYRLEDNESVPDGIKRIANEQIDKALASLKNEEIEIEERIHDARKRFKKIRAVMRLVRDEIGEEIYHRENKTYRDAGRELSSLRESAVAIQTLDDITDRFEDELADTAFKELRKNLVERNQAVRYQTLNNQTIEKVIEQITSARPRINKLPIENDDFSALHDGLKRVYKRGYKGLENAYEQPIPENFHEWRKRVKYLWYHMRILRLVWHDMQSEFADSIHDLSDYLGDAHDFVDFNQLLTNHPDLAKDTRSVEVIQSLSHRWQKALEAQAKPLGQRIYAEKPKHFMHRMKSYWQATEQETIINAERIGFD